MHDDDDDDGGGGGTNNDTTTTNTRTNSQHDAPATHAILSLAQWWVSSRGKRRQLTTREKLAEIVSVTLC